MTTVINIENLSKKYVIGHQKQERYATLRDVMAHKLRGFGERIRHPLSPNREEIALEEFWALKDINLEIKQGDRAGIIGRNGAGKSTLLKVLSRITKPTKGRISIKGRVASLLEVGTGFHPELTGRENIYLNGAILGMSKVEIKNKFDEIVAFAEVERFLDTPVKRYSSGMYVRLAFAVAAHLEPEILIVDEVLAVGDLQFQKKCLGKMEEVGEEGRTVLFVSHNMAAVNSLCNKAILIDNGQISEVGAIEKVLDRYMQRDIVNRAHSFINQAPEDSQAKARILEAYMLGQKKEPATLFLVDRVSYIQLVWQLNVQVPFLRVGLEIVDSMGVVVLSSMDTDATNWHGKSREPGIFNETMEMPSFTLMPGIYSVRAFAGMPCVERIMEMDDILKFEVVDNRTHHTHVPGVRRTGYIATPLNWEVNFERVGRDRQ